MNNESFPLTNSYKDFVDYFGKNDIKTIQDDLRKRRDRLPMIFDVLYQKQRSITKSSFHLKLISADESNWGEEKTIEKIMTYIADTLNEKQNSLLEKAIDEGNLSKAAFLLSHHYADVNQPLPSGNSPLKQAIKSQSFIIGKLLIEKGANVNEKDPEGGNPIHWVLTGEFSE